MVRRALFFMNPAWSIGAVWQNFIIRHLNSLSTYGLNSNQYCLDVKSGCHLQLLDLKSHPTILGCQKVHAQLIKLGAYLEGFMGDRLVSVYANCNCFDATRKLFDEIPSKDILSWNSVISSFLHQGKAMECLDLYYEMKSLKGCMPNDITLISVLPACAFLQSHDVGRCIHNYCVKTALDFVVQVSNALIHMYGKCNFISSAFQLFNTMTVKNLVSWNSIMAVCSQNVYAEVAINMFITMRSTGIKPDNATVLSVLQSCAKIASVNQVKMIHGYTINHGSILAIPVVTGLMNAYSRSGCLDDCIELFRLLKSPDLICYTAMLSAYAIHGCGREAIKMFEYMVEKGFKPDHVTFTHVLCACSHSGLVTEGQRYFADMVKIYALEAKMDHYVCMVNLLGRAGHLERACQVIANMSIEPNAAVWGALACACKTYQNAKLGKVVAEKLLTLDPLDSRNYVMLSNMYSAQSLWTEVSQVRSLMKEKGLRKEPGCSFIECGSKIYRFVSGDRSHPDSKNIYHKLEQILEKIKRVGYVPMTEFILHEVDEEMKKDMIEKHSEKLAIAFGLLVIHFTLPIIITKNLRICGDCHNASKFISKVENRTIIIRDIKRFHHFIDGSCSCSDYW